ncbi:MAG: type II toxin-antitoxin system VapC family toxin [Solirubrobacterales bacterium]|nr:type II toxin-antitoxin system VapC family toxin [Solirubrobacterales bacterium]
MIVVDCSAIVDSLAVPDGSAELRALLSGEELNAPMLIDFEFVSAARGLRLGGVLSEARALDALTDFEDLRLQRWEQTATLRRRAFELRENLTAFDAAYVALAEALDCGLVTRDERLARSSGHLVATTVI